MRLTDSLVVGNTVIEVAFSDITIAEVEVIVNSVCNLLHFGEGVSGAIYLKAGASVYREAQSEIDRKSLCAGDVAVSSGGNLRYQYIFHALSSRCGTGTTHEILKSCVENCLSIARRKNIRSIAFPALGTGTMAFSIERAAEILIDTAIRDCASNPGIERVVFCLLRPSAFTSFFREAVKRSVEQKYQDARKLLGLSEDSGNDMGEEALSRLSNCKPGRDDWQDFEGAAIGLFEFLFVPPLSQPHIQTRSKSGLKIRDAVFPNHAEDGFWNRLDLRYDAKMIVLECKNSSNAIGQEAIEQVSRYLRGRALGKVGFIASRTDPSEEAREAQREVFREFGHLILSISDFDFSQMLDMRRLAKRPEEYLERKIDNFSLEF